MATNPRLRSMQQQIQQQGLTRDQAKGKYGLTDQDADWMNNNLGLRFAPAGSKPAGLMAAGAPATMTTTAAQGPVKAAMSPIRPTTQSPAPAPTVAPVVATPPAAQATSGQYGATAADATKATAAQANVVNQGKAATYRAAQGKGAVWRPGEQATVQGQLADIVDSGSPLMEMAETRGLQQANRRGLMNSSMAVQAGQAALYDAAMPIATQDASTFATAGQFNAGNKQDMTLANMDSRNTAGQFNASEKNDRGALNSQLGTQVNIANAGAKTETSQLNATTATDVSKFNSSEKNDARQFNATLNADISKFNVSESNDLTALGMDNNTRLQLGTIEANYKTLMQTQASAGELYKQTMTNLAAILQNKDMTPLAKAQAIANLVGSMNAGMETIGDIANMNLPELDFEDVGGTLPDNSSGGGTLPDNSSGGGDGDGDGDGDGEGTASNGYDFPSSIPGIGSVSWDDPATPNSSTSLREAYEDYLSENSNAAGWGVLPPGDWYKLHKAGSGTGSPGSGDSGP